MKRTIDTFIDIAASAACVWTIIIAFDRYVEWNPFITSGVGAPIAGTKLDIRIEPPGQVPMTFKPTILTVKPERQLTWLGHLVMPGLFDGRHELRIESRGDGCRFFQSEQFSGILVRLFGTKLITSTQSGFEAMNVALKERAEAVRLI